MLALLFSIIVLGLSEVRGKAMFPRPFICNQFYYNVDDDTYDVICPQTMAFEVTSRKCVPKERTNCPPSWTTVENPCHFNSEGLFPYPSDCNYYYSCNNGGFAFIYECPDGREFSPSHFYCAPPQEAGCTPVNGSTAVPTGTTNGTTPAVVPPAGSDQTTTPSATNSSVVPAGNGTATGTAAPGASTVSVAAGTGPTAAANGTSPAAPAAAGTTATPAPGRK